MLAQNTVCAVVKLELNQEATLEREAFDAHLALDNGSGAALQDLFVNVSITDDAGQPADGAFFVKINSLAGTNGVDGSGVVQSSSTADIHWLIIPSTGAGGTNPLGRSYSISASISFSNVGAPQFVQTLPARITVKPQPALKLEYLLPFEVFADQPLTPEIEPVEPFPLGVRVTNVGFGTARNFKIDSAQPRIAEDKQGLLVDFKLLGTVVSGKTVPNTLMIPFGDIPADSVSLAEWTMATTLSGRFTQFSSTFTHAAELGGQLTSLIQQVTTYTLLKDVAVDLPGRDAIPDFLVNVSQPRGESMQALLDSGGDLSADMILESDQAQPLPVVEAPSALTGQLGGGNMQVTLNLTGSAAPSAWVHTSVPFPDGANASVLSARRADGTIVNPKNVWVAKHFRKSDKTTLYRLNVLDFASTAASYVLQFSAPTLDPPPGAVTNFAAATGLSGGRLGLTWTAPGEDGYAGTLLGGRYLIQASEDPNAPFSPASAQINRSTSTSPGNLEDFLASGLVGNTTFFLRLWTQDSGGNVSSISNAATAYTLPNPPTSASFVSISSSTLEINWQSGNNRSPAATLVSLSASAEGLAVSSSPLIDALTRGFVFTNLAPNTSYFASGRGLNPITGASSALSAFGLAVTSAEVPAPAPFSDIGASSVTAHWTAGSNPADTEFFVELSSSSQRTPLLSSSGWIRSSQFVFPKLSPATTYYAQVKARNRAMAETAYSDLGPVKTAPVDTMAPRTALIVGSPSFDGALLFVSSDTVLSLSSVDDKLVVDDAIGVGVAQTFLSIDSASFTLASGTFSLTAEGMHTLQFYSVDLVDNTEAARSAAVWVDATPPVTTAAIGAPLFTAIDGAVYIATTTPITLLAADLTLLESSTTPAVAGSGVARIEVSVDTGPFTVYMDTLTFTEGRHTLTFRAVDNVGNRELPKSATVFVDATPPVTALSIGAPRYAAPDGTLFVGPAAPFALASQDPTVQDAASGVSAVSARVDAAAFALYTATFTLSPGDGPRTVSWFAADNVGNAETPKVSTVALDETAPRTSLLIAGGRQLAGPDASTFYASSDTRLVLVSIDLAVSGAASGVAFTRWQDDGGAFQTYLSGLALAEGAHALAYQSSDNVENLEVPRSTNVWIDAAPPVSSFAFGAPYHKAADGTHYVTPATPVTFAADDPALPTGQAGSGVSRLEVAVDGGPFAVYTSSLTFAEGRHRVLYRSIDGVANVEATRRLDVQSDATPPMTALALSGGHQFQGPDASSFFASADTLYSLPTVDPVVKDVASGAAFTRRQDNGGPSQFFAAPFTLAEGVHRLDYQSQDHVSNLEVPRSTTVLVDATAPRTALKLVGGHQFPGPDAATFYASSDTRVALPAADPVAGGVASGLAFTRYQNGDGPFQTFVSTFGLSEGAHRLGYQSQDNVHNLEVLRSTNVWIDAAPPASSFALGAPYHMALDGTHYLTPATPVMFAALEPALPTGQPGSGVSRIEVAIDGGPFTVYSAALTFAEGRHTILYRAVDNVANVEIVHTLQVRSDATPPVSSLVVGEPRFQLPSVLLVSTRTPFSIAPVDPVSNNVAAGVKDISFRVSDTTPVTSAFSAFTAPFMMAGADVRKVIEFYSRDNVHNAEVVRSSTVLLDSTPPEIALLSPASCGAGICRVLKGKFPVLGAARDAHFGDYRLEYAAGQDASTGFALISSGTLAVSSGTLGAWDATALSGWLTLRLTAADLVANAASLSLNVFVGDPGQILVLGNHEVFDMPEGVAAGGDGKIYVADRNNDRIAVFSSIGALLASLGGRKDDDDDGDEDADDDKHKKSTATLRLNKPSGVAVDAAGNIYVADTNRDRVLKLSAAGQVLLTLGRRERHDENEHARALPGQFRHPAGVAVDEASNIYVADTGNRRVQVFSSTGAFSLQFSLPPVPARLDDDDGDDDDDEEGRVQLGKPSGIAVDAAGQIYVADSKGGRALKFSAAGQLLLTIPIPGDKPGKFGQPFGVAVSTGGDCLLVSDRKTSRILKFDFLGNSNLVFGGKGKIKDEDAPVVRSALVFKKPMGLALDAQGNLFVADRNNGRIHKLGLPTGQAPLVVPPPKAEDEHIARDVVDVEDGGKIERRDRAAVDIPAGAVAADLKISVSTPAFSVADDSNRRRAAEDAKLKAASPPVEYGPEGTKFKGSVTLTLPYSPELLALQKIDAADLKVRYWNRGKSEWEDLESVVDPKTRTVKAKTTHFSLYQVYSGTVSAAAIAPLAADATFTFHDAYAFPNPVRGAGAVTIRMQTGLADSVEVRVYDVSGRKILSSSNFSLNPSLDDGNGKGEQYTYDHVWDVSGVGSGIYQYVITARKAGHADIHKTGRVGVVK